MLEERNQRNRHSHRCRDASVDSAGLSAKNNFDATHSAQVVGLAKRLVLCVAPFAESRPSICARFIGRRKRVQTKNLGGRLRGVPLVATSRAGRRRGRNGAGCSFVPLTEAESRRHADQVADLRVARVGGKGVEGENWGGAPVPVFPSPPGASRLKVQRRVNLQAGWTPKELKSV